jgi:hypothetical protein
MACKHDTFHSLRSSYDRGTGLLVYYWVCERCGVELQEARREPYRPQYDPHGNDRFLSAQPR